MGTRTDAALSQVVAARGDLAHEIDRLEAAGRAAVDIPAKIRRSPAKAAAVAGGAAFLAVGGPRRVFRRARKAVTGHEQAPLPKALLPKEIEKALKKMGSDGDQVRGTIERDFSKYLDERAKERRKEGDHGGRARARDGGRPTGRDPGRQARRRPDDEPRRGLVRGAARRRSGPASPATPRPRRPSREPGRRAASGSDRAAAR